MNTTTIRLACVQTTPVFLDRERTVAKAVGLIEELGSAGADLAVFPEAFIPCYPAWVWFIPPVKTAALRELYAELVENAVTVPGPDVDILARAARNARCNVVIGVNEVNAEASRTTLYNTLLFISDEGRLLGAHRKLVPTVAERSIWGHGDARGLAVYDTPVGRIGGLICWENYMPLARQALYNAGLQFHAAPTWDRGEPWISTLRHIGKEGRVFVLGSCQVLHRDDIPDRLGFKKEFLPDSVEWLNPGLSVIVNPDGKVVAGPAEGIETILYAEARRAELTGPRFQLDVAGHYARPDIFSMTVRPRGQAMVTVLPENEAGESEADASDAD
jgi:nitrilase